MIPINTTIAANSFRFNLGVVFLFTFGAFILAGSASLWGHAFAAEAITLHFGKLTVPSAKVAGPKTGCKKTIEFN